LKRKRREGKVRKWREEEWKIERNRRGKEEKIGGWDDRTEEEEEEKERRV